MHTWPTRWFSVVLFTLAVAGCTTTPPPQRPSPSAEPSAAPAEHIGSGKASYYGSWHQNKLTASGERFNQASLTAAHRTLPFGTRVRVVNTRNGKSVVVRINDRGPYSRGRIIDLSKAAFQRIGDTKHGVIPVRLEKAE